jgi:hypothetical protein
MSCFIENAVLPASAPTIRIINHDASTLIRVISAIPL